MTVRKAAKAGTWYPADPDTLRKMLQDLLPLGPSGEEALGIVSPHAGYAYSGPVAGKLYARIVIPESVVILAPRHTARGTASFSLWPAGSWMTPLGEMGLDEELRDLVLERCSLLEEDREAHLEEHAVELQVPFLQFKRPDVRIIPIVIGTHDMRSLRKLGEDLAAAIRDLGRKVLIVASSDMNHYESQEETLRKDTLAIDKILALDEDGLSEAIERYDISMCGFSPTVSMLVAAKALGASRARLVEHTTSSAMSGNDKEVVGYAAIIVS